MSRGEMTKWKLYMLCVIGMDIAYFPVSNRKRKQKISKRAMKMTGYEAP